MSKVIALTFDDGPDEETFRILEILKKHKVRATFFCIGKRTDVPKPHAVTMAYQDGHQIANHSYSHPDNNGRGLSVLSKEEVLEELKKTQAAIHNAIGREPRFFRAPYGQNGGFVEEALSELGLKPHVHWDIETDDWGFRPNGCTSAQKIEGNIMEKASDKYKILCHDGVDLHGVGCSHRRNTTEALDKAIPRLKEDGYIFVTIAELDNEEPYK